MTQRPFGGNTAPGKPPLANCGTRRSIQQRFKPIEAVDGRSKLKRENLGVSVEIACRPRHPQPSIAGRTRDRSPFD
jgi:hypothetical protein